MFVCLLNHSDMISEIKVHAILLLFHFVSVLSITNHEKQEKIEYTTKYQNEQFSQLTNSKNLVKYDAVTPARTKQSASSEITKMMKRRRVHRLSKSYSHLRTCRVPPAQAAQHKTLSFC